MYFGIDIGGTTVKIGVVENLKILDSYEIPTVKDTLWEDICLSLKSYLDIHGCKLEGIGFGVPGNVINGKINRLPNIGIENVDLKAIIATYFPDVPIAVQNDANVAALGEMLHHNDYKNACLITLGTGVGCGIIIDGKIVEGKHGTGGEVGHFILAPEYNFACTCGLKGCLETVASATGICRLANYHRHEFKTTLPTEFTARDVFLKAKAGDSLCNFVIDRVGFYLAKCLATLAVCVDTDVYYLGGGVAKMGDILLNAIRKHYPDFAHYAVKDINIELATLGNKAGILGAASLVGGDGSGGGM